MNPNDHDTATTLDSEPRFTVELPADVREDMDRPSEVDAGAVLAWLETGENDPWPNEF